MMEKSLVEFLKEYGDYLNQKNDVIATQYYKDLATMPSLMAPVLCKASFEGFVQWLSKPTKPDTTRDLPKNKATPTAGVNTPSSDKDRLREEFYEKFVKKIPHIVDAGNSVEVLSWKDNHSRFPDDVWNWILSHAKEIGELQKEEE